MVNRLNGRDTALWVGLPVLVLALGHTLSNLVRTVPAIATDVIAVDLLVSAESVASLASAYHFAFAAGQIPVGVALDRYGVRNVSLTLLVVVTLAAGMALWVRGPVGFLLMHAGLGLGCCGMLLAPMTLVAKTMPPFKFALWSGVVQSVGNSGMLLSASPLAWLVEHQGWRSAFMLTAGLSVLLVLGVYFLVPRLPERLRQAPKASLLDEAREVVRIGMTPALRGAMAIAMVSFAASITIRGMWGGPWLMEIKGLDRVAAGQGMLPLTLALVAGPVLFGLLDRRIGRTAIVLALGHFVAGTALIVLALSQTRVWEWLHLGGMPVSFDVSMLFVFGLAMGSSPLVFALGRTLISSDQAGKALAAINLSFFVGAALIQSTSGPVGSLGGIPSVMAYVGLLMWAAVVYFGYRMWWRGRG